MSRDLYLQKPKHPQETNIYTSGGNRTHIPSKWAATDPPRTPHGNLDD